MAIQFLKRTRTRPVLPYDLLHIILTELKRTDSLGSLALLQRCNSDYYDIVTPILYTHVRIRTDDQLQRFLTLPIEPRVRKRSRRLSLLSSKGSKSPKSGLRSRSGSLIAYEKKLHAFQKVKTITLDIYPSRRSMKIAGKLPFPLFAETLTFTPSAILSLHSKLLRSGAPRILATFWAGHLPSIVQPQRVVVDYSTIDIRSHLAGEKKASWWDTIAGLSSALQQWERLDQVTLVGEYWALLVPSPGVEMKVIHTVFEPKEDAEEDEGALTEGEDSDGNPEVPLQQTIPGGPAPPPHMVNLPPNAMPVPIPAPAANAEEDGQPPLSFRAKLLMDRRDALLLGLRTSYQIVQHAQYQAHTQPHHLTSYVPEHFIHKGSRNVREVRWVVEDFFPPVGEGDEEDENDAGDEETEVVEKSEKERREVVKWLVTELDQQCPQLVHECGRMVDERVELSCISWA
ncbi:hypothetical protein I350_04314 [Cryptococcus amylolentus CBS 6273]|uniref:F-box domain-containing protein n=1 Tax=Cryptococcus amylolentus CBS 6273 TaxID=1296118 RepID=A0A1E3K401_9TREE|nr:hypothetical protein I350_04314 [Cryptococcus amylolentus CBS 6273]